MARPDMVALWHSHGSHRGRAWRRRELAMDIGGTDAVGERARTDWSRVEIPSTLMALALRHLARTRECKRSTECCITGREPGSGIGVYRYGTGLARTIPVQLRGRGARFRVVRVRGLWHHHGFVHTLR